MLSVTKPSARTSTQQGNPATCESGGRGGRRHAPPPPQVSSPETATEIATQTVCLAVPLLPGRTVADRNAMVSCAAGERRAEHRASRRRHGITRESVWIQATPEATWR